MAELNDLRNRKATPRVDLTAMVDLAFLLITFFMLTTSLSKPAAMDIVKPDNGPEDLELPASRTMTILLGKQDKVIWYMGESGKDMPNIADYHQIRLSILANKNQVETLYGHKSKKSLIVIIKPTSGASFENFVDIIDELHLANISAAPAIDDDHFTIEEKDFMIKNNLL